METRPADWTWPGISVREGRIAGDREERKHSRRSKSRAEREHGKNRKVIGRVSGEREACDLGQGRKCEGLECKHGL